MIHGASRTNLLLHLKMFCRSLQPILESKFTQHNSGAHAGRTTASKHALFCCIYSSLYRVIGVEATSVYNHSFQFFQAVKILGCVYLFVAF